MAALSVATTSNSWAHFRARFPQGSHVPLTCRHFCLGVAPEDERVGPLAATINESAPKDLLTRGATVALGTLSQYGTGKTHSNGLSTKKVRAHPFNWSLSPFAYLSLKTQRSHLTCTSIWKIASSLRRRDVCGRHGVHCNICLGRCTAPAGAGRVAGSAWEPIRLSMCTKDA